MTTLSGVYDKYAELEEMRKTLDALLETYNAFIEVPYNQVERNWNFGDFHESFSKQLDVYIETYQQRIEKAEKQILKRKVRSSYV